MKQHFNKAFTITASIIGALIIGVSGDRISNLLFGTEDTEKQTVQKTEVLAKNSRIDNQVLKRIELMVQSINSNNEEQIYDSISQVADNMNELEKYKNFSIHNMKGKFHIQSLYLFSILYQTLIERRIFVIFYRIYIL